MARRPAAVANMNREIEQPQCTLDETPLIRKEPLGMLSAARRLAAGWQGRRERKEIVVR